MKVDLLKFQAQENQRAQPNQQEQINEDNVISLEDEVEEPIQNYTMNQVKKHNIKSSSTQKQKKSNQSPDLKITKKYQNSSHHKDSISSGKSSVNKSGNLSHFIQSASNIQSALNNSQDLVMDQTIAYQNEEQEQIQSQSQGHDQQIQNSIGYENNNINDQENEERDSISKSIASATSRGESSLIMMDIDQNEIKNKMEIELQKKRKMEVIKNLFEIKRALQVKRVMAAKQVLDQQDFAEIDRSTKTILNYGKLMMFQSMQETFDFKQLQQNQLSLLNLEFNQYYVNEKDLLINKQKPESVQDDINKHSKALEKLILSQISNDFILSPSKENFKNKSFMRDDGLVADDLIQRKITNPELTPVKDLADQFKRYTYEGLPKRKPPLNFVQNTNSNLTNTKSKQCTNKKQTSTTTRTTIINSTTTNLGKRSGKDTSIVEQAMEESALQLKRQKKQQNMNLTKLATTAELNKQKLNNQSNSPVSLNMQGQQDSNVPAVSTTVSKRSTKNQNSNTKKDSSKQQSSGISIVSKNKSAASCLVPRNINNAQASNFNQESNNNFGKGDRARKESLINANYTSTRDNTNEDDECQMIELD
eukprot:403338586